MARLPIAFCPRDVPPPPSQPPPEPSPLAHFIAHTIDTTDYDLVCLPLTNARWMERWERLCLRPLDEEEQAYMNGGGGSSGEGLAALQEERERTEDTDREADVWRKDPSLNRNECNITRFEDAADVVALASDWLELDSFDEGIRFDSELGLRAEMQHALYLGVPTLVLPAPSLANRQNLPAYAHVISNLLQMGGPGATTKIAVRIPVSDPLEIIGQGPAPPNHANGNGNGHHSRGPSVSESRHHRRMSSLSSRPPSMHQAQLSLSQLNQVGQGHNNNNTGPIPAHRVTHSSSQANNQAAGASAMATQAMQSDPSSTWEMWDCIRALCGYHPRLTVMLDLSNPLPPSVGALQRWTAEPVKHIWLPASSFIPNAKGYPVLSKACQAFIRGMTKQGPTFILSDTTSGRHSAGGQIAYVQYIRHVTSQPSPQLPASARVPDGVYGDLLQKPLQPLMDDLGCETYDVFERDPVKYRQYEEATYLAVVERAAMLGPNLDLVIVVAGAGRGPLVSCALHALERAKVSGRIYAVEKNPSAFTTLQERKELEWGNAVEIMFGDMRTLPVPEPADILISELLGSFGDNELSPECIDGGMRFLKSDGVSIPTSYTAWLAPIASSKLYHEVTEAAARPDGGAAAKETPYVVMMQQVNLLSSDGGGSSGRCGPGIQQCWQFEHPRRDLVLDAFGLPVTNSHNTRSATLTFHIPHASPCHGFAGYFEAHLYGNVGLSTHPDTAHRVSPDMFSWFPLFFPLKSPLYLPSGAELEVNIWRLVDQRARKVWYEWAAEAYLPVAPPTSGSPTLRPPSFASGNNVTSPMMDAPFSPTAPAAQAFGAMLQRQQAAGGIGRVKIGQTELHNPSGKHYWVGL